MQRHIFYDELGNEVEFFVKAEFSHEDMDYIAMSPVEDIYAPTYILRVSFDESGQEFLENLDYEELTEVTEAYEALMKEQLQ